MEVSLAAEHVFTLFGLKVSNALLTGWILVLALLLTAYRLRGQLRQIPGRAQAALEMIYEAFEENCRSILGNEDAVRDILPFALTLFFYIIFSNWAGLLPGFESLKLHGIPLFRSPSTDLNTTVGLAAITMAYIQYLGFKYQGFRGYLGKFFTLKSPLEFFVGLQEFISELTRVISFSFRLFGNIFAGEVMITVVIYLVSTFLPYVFFLPVPFYGLEIFVGFIQAFVFSFLSIIFTALAVSSHHDEHGEPEIAVA